jgi:hypothetical protein
MGFGIPMNPEPKPVPQMANVPTYAWSATTSTNNTNIFVGPVTYCVTSDCEVKKDATSRWLARCKAKADKWFAEELIRIKAECKANEWRPHVGASNKAEHDLDLSWWSLGKPDSDEDLSNPPWRKELWRWKHDWCGITVTDASDFEIKAMEAFCDALPKKSVFRHVTESFSDYNKLIGSHDSHSRAYWFKNLEDHNAFDAMLDAIPWRQYFIQLDRRKIRDVRAHFRGKNYRIVEGRDKTKTVVTFAEDPIKHTDMWAKFKFS